MPPFISLSNFTQEAPFDKKIFKVVFLGDDAVGKSEYCRMVSYPCLDECLS
jgi:hypothetical protein